MGNKHIIGDILKRIKRPIELDDDIEYKLVTIKTKHKGVSLRELKKGFEIKSSMYEVKEGDFLISGIDARHGAIGIVPTELDGAIVTNDFWYFEINEEIIIKELFLELTETAWFDEICKKGSDGTTNRVRLQKDKFFNQIIEIPSKKYQNDLLAKIIKFKSYLSTLKKETENQKKLLTKLKQSILQGAIQGKLTEFWRNENPNTESACELLKRIKAGKEQLIKEKKIKKEKILQSITAEEIPFELPEGWVWCRLGEVTTYGTSQKAEPKTITSETWVLDLEDIEKGSSRIIQEISFSNRKSNSTKSVFKKGDVLYSKLRPYLDKVVVATRDGVCTTEILPLPMLGNNNPYYFMFALKRKDFLDYVSTKVGGMKMPRLGTDEGRMALFPLPPLEEQKAIVEKVELLINKCLKLSNEIETLEKHGKMLLKAMFNETFETKKELCQD